MFDPLAGIHLIVRNVHKSFSKRLVAESTSPDRGIYLPDFCCPFPQKGLEAQQTAEKSARISLAVLVRPIRAAVIPKPRVCAARR